MKMHLFRLLGAALFLAAPIFPAAAQTCPPLYAKDFDRDGIVVTNGTYREVGGLAVLPSGKIILTVTQSAVKEGDPDQHAAIYESTDGGDTWSFIQDIDPPSMAESSWWMPSYDPAADRLWFIGMFNKNNVREIPYNDRDATSKKVVAIGWPRLQYSDDEGQTLTVLPPGYANYQPTAADNRNPFGGLHKLAWFPPGTTRVRNGWLYAPYAKRGKVLWGKTWDDSEAFILKFPLNATDALDKIEFLPDGNYGMTAPNLLPDGSSAAGGDSNEEPAFDFFDDGRIYGVFRTDAGYLAEFRISADEQSITTGWAQREDGAAGRPVPHPRATPWVKNTGNGKWLLGVHNNTYKDLGAGRNTYWIYTGEESPTVPGKIIWNKGPKAIVAQMNITRRMQGPAPIEVGDDYLFVMNDKHPDHDDDVRVFKFPKDHILCD
ncbi:sialidase family protein [Methyloceanibacter caenitepidi]|nr:sialidase family protein [Methyloceanibacter caenitepidi]